MMTIQIFFSKNYVSLGLNDNGYQEAIKKLNDKGKLSYRFLDKETHKEIKYSDIQSIKNKNQQKEKRKDEIKQKLELKKSEENENFFKNNKDYILSNIDDEKIMRNIVRFFIILNSTAKMFDNYHTGIRKPSEIKYPEDVFGNNYDNEAYDKSLFTKEASSKALKTNKITVYSSYPIKNGTFVTPFEEMAKDYSGGKPVYNKTVDINDISWIYTNEGIYTKPTSSTLKELKLYLEKI